MTQSRWVSFYGWRMAVAAWFMYGFQVVGYYGWGFYLPETTEELGLSRAGGGFVFGVMTLVGGVVAPVVGMAIGRFGLRWCMTFGFVASSLGYYLTGLAQNVVHLTLTFGILVAGTHAFAGLLPTQTIASIWFVKYRARVMAALLAASGLMSKAVYAFHAWVLENGSWRWGWELIAWINLGLGVFAFLCIRDSPEKLGQLPDGAASREELEAASAGSAAQDLWTAREALRTYQFSMMVLCGLGYAVPWGVLTNHGRLHLQDNGLGISAAAGVLGTMVLVSTLGRLGGGLGDFLPPPRLLGCALALEGLGVTFFLYAQTEATATAAAIFIGLGFGLAITSQAATFAYFFGRTAFATTTGVRFMIGAFFSASMPALAGWVFDTRGSYELAFLTLAALSLGGSVAAFALRTPRHPSLEEAEAGTA